MKQKLIIFAWLLLLGCVQTEAQPRHRHHAVAAVKADSATADAAATADAIEAFSDTTAVAADADDAFSDYDEEPVASPGAGRDPSRYGDPFSWIDSLSSRSLGVMGTIFAILAVIFVVVLLLLLIFGPILVVVLALRYLVRRHNDRVSLAEKAMETGQPLPEEFMPVDRQSDEFLRRRGIRNIWIGIGMVIMFGIWDANILEGLGALVLCYGIGQLLIARSSQKKQRDDNPQQHS